MADSTRADREVLTVRRILVQGLSNAPLASQWALSVGPASRPSGPGSVSVPAPAVQAALLLSFMLGQTKRPTYCGKS